ncbi:MAG: glycosyltransferase family 39 protein [Gemmatimonadetes bacterium]|nr:glycosyltransferase family 39 protein [Gemmatimonadota bacterium]
MSPRESASWGAGAAQWIGGPRGVRGQYLFWGAVLLILAIGSFLRLYRPLYMAALSDEAQYTRMGLEFLKGPILPPHDASGATRFLFILSIAGLEALGVDELLSGRLVAAGFGILLIPLTMVLAHRLYRQRSVTLLVGAWTCLLPLLVLISRIVLTETMILCWLWLFYLCLLIGRERESIAWFAGAGMVAALGLWTKEYMVLGVLSGLLYLAIADRSVVHLVRGARRGLLVALLIYPLPFVFADNVTVESFVWTTQAVWSPPAGGGLTSLGAEVKVLVDAVGAWHPLFWVLTPVLLGLAAWRSLAVIRERGEDLLLLIHSLVFFLANFASNAFSYRYLYVVIPVVILACRAMYDLAGVGARTWEGGWLPARRLALGGLVLVFLGSYARLDWHTVNTRGWDEPLESAVAAALRANGGTVAIGSYGYLHTINYHVRRMGYEEEHYEPDLRHRWTHVNARAVYRRTAAAEAQGYRVETVRTFPLEATEDQLVAQLEEATLILLREGTAQRLFPPVASDGATSAPAGARAVLDAEFEGETRGIWLVYRRRAARLRTQPG